MVGHGLYTVRGVFFRSGYKEVLAINLRFYWFLGAELWFRGQRVVCFSTSQYSKKFEIKS